MERISTSGHLLILEVEGKLSKIQKSVIETVFNYAGTVFFGNDIRGVLCKELEHSPHFNKVGAGGNHVWIADGNDERIAIIKIKDMIK